MKSKSTKLTKWLPIWIGDIRRETIGKPPEFLGMYLNLMMAAWENDGHLVDDERVLSRISGGTFDQWIEYRQELANLFVPRHGVWSHNMLRDELKKAETISIRRKNASKKGNEVRWGNAKKKTDELLEKIKEDGNFY